MNQEIIATIRSHSRELARELDMLKGVFSNTGFTYSECHILFELEQHKILNLADLSEIINIDKSNTSRILKQLVRKGYIEVKTHPSDGRQKLFSLSIEGLNAVEHNNCLANDQVEAALKLLSAEKAELVIAGLKTYAAALKRSRLQKYFQLRKIEERDNPFVAKLIREVMTEFGCTGPGYSINDEEVDFIYENYTNDRSCYFVLVRDNIIVGGGGIGPLKGGGPDICELKKMYFYPEARGVGWGKKLLEHLLEEAKMRGYKQCYLETVERLWQANLLYKQAGFERLEKPLGSTGHGSCELHYIKAL